MFILNMNISWNTAFEENDERTELYNFKKKDDFDNFKEATRDNQALRTCFDDPDEDLNTACNRWFSILNSTIKNCFQRI